MRFLLFPGQGRPEASLLWRHHRIKSDLLDCIEQRLGRKLSIEDFEDNIAYSALLVADGIATCQRYQEAGGQIAGVAGYSTGQFSALVAAGFLEAEATLELVIRRAQLMIQCVGSGFGMLAVLGLDEKSLQAALDSRAERNLYIATKNGPRSFSVSGAIQDLQALKKDLDEGGVVKKASLLPVAGAWHSPMLADAAREFAELVRSTPMQKPRARFWDNVTGCEAGDEMQIRGNLVRHLTSPVEWEASIRSMRRFNPTAWIECGSGNQLRQMLFFIDRAIPSYGMHSEEEIRKCAELQD